MRKISSNIIIAGIFSLTILEIYALSKGIDGKVLSAVIGIIALTIGIKLPTPKILQ